MYQNNSSLSGLLPGENNRHLRPSVTRTKYVDTFTRPTLPLKIYLEYAQCLIAAVFSAMFSQQQMDCCLLQQVEMAEPSLSDQTKDFQPISSEQRQQKSSQDHKGQAFITCLLPFLAGDMWTKKNN